jgi:hypothetical protein
MAVSKTPPAEDAATPDPPAGLSKSDLQDVIAGAIQAVLANLPAPAAPAPPPSQQQFSGFDPARAGAGYEKLGTNPRDQRGVIRLGNGLVLCDPAGAPLIVNYSDARQLIANQPALDAFAAKYAAKPVGSAQLARLARKLGGNVKPQAAGD